MADVARPRHVRDVEQPVDARLQLDEGAEVRQVAHAPGDPVADRVPLVDRGPRIRLDLLHAERDALGGLVHVEHHHVDLVADVHDLRRMADATGPRHLGHVDQPFHARLELDEGPVVGEAHHAAAHLRARRVLGLDDLPRVRRLLLVAERHASALAVEVKDNDLDLITHLEDFRGMTNPTPGHIRDVQEAVDAAEVDERSVIRDVLHRAGQHHALGENLQRVLLLLLALLFQHGAA
jgi:hypothetical protein